MTKKYVFFTSIISFILTVIWITSNVYHSYATSTIEPLLQIQIQEISPTFDEEALADLKQRTVIESSNGTLIQPVTISEIATNEAEIIEPEIIVPNTEGNLNQADVLPPEEFPQEQFETEPNQTEEVTP